MNTNLPHNNSSYKNHGIGKIILDIILKIFDYIYDFLFNWEDDPYEEENFIENEKIKHSIVKTPDKNIESNIREFKLIKNTFGTTAADYIFGLRQEVDYLIKKHGLVYENTIRVVIPPEKLNKGNLSPKILEETMESIYSQYNKDVILKPGKINVIGSGEKTFLVELEIENYTINEEILSTI